MFFALYLRSCPLVDLVVSMVSIYVVCGGNPLSERVSPRTLSKAVPCTVPGVTAAIGLYMYEQSFHYLSDL